MSPSRNVYLHLAQNLGLAVGAAGWGIGSDIIGRRWAFNLTVRPPRLTPRLEAGTNICCVD